MIATLIIGANGNPAIMADACDEMERLVKGDASVKVTCPHDTPRASIEGEHRSGERRLLALQVAEIHAPAATTEKGAQVLWRCAEHKERFDFERLAGNSKHAHRA